MLIKDYRHFIHAQMLVLTTSQCKESTVNIPNTHKLLSIGQLYLYVDLLQHSTKVLYSILFMFVWKFPP